MGWNEDADRAARMSSTIVKKYSPNFRSTEFKCKGRNCCGNKAYVDPKLIEVLEKIRAEASKEAGKTVPIRINSGYRCRVHNASINGAPQSQHVLGKAADISCDTKLLSIEKLGQIADRIIREYKGGMKRYPAFVHVDVCDTPPNRRW